MRGPYPPSFGEYGDAETLTLNVFDLASELPSAILARIVSAFVCIVQQSWKSPSLRRKLLVMQWRRCSEVPSHLAVKMGVLHAVLAILLLVADAQYTVPSIWPQVLFALDIPVSFLIVLIGEQLTFKLGFNSTWLFPFLCLTLGSLWYAVLGWAIQAGLHRMVGAKAKNIGG